jgi:hypothetical protein
VLTPWARGHHVRWFSGLPVVATPFGVEGGEGAMEDSSRFLLATAQADAEEVLARRGVRWIVLQDLDADLLLGAKLLGVGGVEAVQSFHGFTFPIVSAEGYGRVGPRLYYRYGTGENGAAPLDGFRLLDEDAPGDGVEPVKLFERVRGARLAVSGVAPRSQVEALVEVETPTGRGVPFLVRAQADAGGNASVRIPYATGPNGRAKASPCLVREGARSALVLISEDAVVRGAAVSVALRAEAKR